MGNQLCDWASEAQDPSKTFLMYYPIKCRFPDLEAGKYSTNIVTSKGNFFKDRILVEQSNFEGIGYDHLIVPEVTSASATYDEAAE